MGNELDRVGHIITQRLSEAANHRGGVCMFTNHSLGPFVLALPRAYPSLAGAEDFGRDRRVRKVGQTKPLGARSCVVSGELIAIVIPGTVTTVKHPCPRSVSASF